MIIKVKPPEMTPVGLTDVKAHLRLDHSHEDEYLLQLIRAASDSVEQFLGQSLLRQTFQYLWQPGTPKSTGLSHEPDDLCEIPLLFPPLIQIESVHRILASGKKHPIRRYMISHTHQLPTLIIADSQEAVEIVYQAGYGIRPTAIPPSIFQGILVYIADLYQNRASMGQGVTGMAHDILSTHRVMRLA